MDTKICNKCKNVFPATIEWFSKDNRSQYGIGSICRECDRERGRNYKQRNPNTSKQYYLNHKEQHDIKCKEYYEQNKEHIIAVNKLWSKNHPDAVKEIHKKSYQRCIIQKKEYWNRYKTLHADIIKKRYLEYYQSNKEKCRIASKKWKDNNRLKCNQHVHNYKSKKKSLPRTLTVSQWEAIKLAFDNKCAYCGKEAKIIQEHFIAVNNGGEYTHNNIVPACMVCNTSKNNKSFFDWYPKYRHYSKKREKAVLEFLCYDPNGYQQLKFAETL